VSNGRTWVARNDFSDLRCARNACPTPGADRRGRAAAAGLRKPPRIRPFKRSSDQLINGIGEYARSAIQAIN
jgi:hypothetical protein